MKTTGTMDRITRLILACSRFIERLTAFGRLVLEAVSSTCCVHCCPAEPESSGTGAGRRVCKAGDVAGRGAT